MKRKIKCLLKNTGQLLRGNLKNRLVLVTFDHKVDTKDLLNEQSVTLFSLFSGGGCGCLCTCWNYESQQKNMNFFGGER